MTDPTDTPQTDSAAGAANEFYVELRELAEHYLRRERPDHSLQPTALVHEAYLRLAEQHETQWEDRSRFFAAAAAAIRRVLVNHAIARKCSKRGGTLKRRALIADALGAEEPSIDLIALDEALRDLAERDDRKAKVVELRFFGGLTIEETATVLGVSHRRVERDWRLAKAWLHNEISKGDDCDG